MSDARTRGVQREVLASLALVMLAATGLLAGVLLKTHADQVGVLREFVGHGLMEQTRAPAFALQERMPGIDWWIVTPETGQHRVLASMAEPHPATPGAEDLALASAATDAGRALISSGAPWQAIRFAVPLAPGTIGVLPGEVALARIAPVVSGRAVLALLLLDSGVFSLLGAYMLRQRVVRPLRQLSAAARALSAGGFEARVAVEGVGEVSELAEAFNEMSDALERRTNALEKAVRDLRDSNAQLSRARQGLDRAERLAAVGRLAAGVAHEVGNPMGAILAFLDLARRDGSLSEQAESHLSRAVGQGERVRAILRQLLDFSRPPRAHRSPVDLRHCVEQVIGLVTAQRRYSAIEISVDCPCELPRVWADESMVLQVLLNLLLNAADAVSKLEPARIEVSLRPAMLRQRTDDLGMPGERPADAIECEIRDNGPGIAPEDRDRIFDPFFTTKPPGEGTGLGLATATRLIEELGGALELADPDAAQRNGACFRLKLPAEGSEDTGGGGCAVRGEPGSSSL